MLTVEDAVGPEAFFWLQLAGYLIFAAAWMFLCFALMRGMLDLTSTLARLREARRRPSPIPASGSRIGVSVVDGHVDRLSPALALSARVIPFAVPRKMPTRMVIR